MMQFLLDTIKEFHGLTVNYSGNLLLFKQLNYPLLAYNWPTVIFWILFFQQLYQPSIYIRALLTKDKRDSSFRNKLKWSAHFCSQVHAVAVVFLCFKYYISGSSNNNVSDFDPQVITLTNFSLGYFIWDLITSVMDISQSGLAFVAHALVAINCLLFAYRPAIHSFVPAVLSSELSTVFLNNIWFCDKLGYSGSKFQALNGILLVLAFFSVRIVYGAFSFANLALQLLENLDFLGNYLVFSTLLCIIVLWPLNLLWMYKILSSFYSRFKLAQLKQI
ncbi:hypothetical protein BB561_003834 [Smittium simulii]|uniref:TLC domain-containing protein n=1 Tax=Smittium simulii TaxID=133385 RepID=A0A2T9YJB4_9FUNG|nr:hypothetical protein BB561_003834 [Smittium simulii]